MPVLQEVTDRLARSADVVGDHGVRVEVARRPVHEHQCCPRAPLLMQIGVIMTRRDDDDPVDAPLAEGADQLALAIRILVAAAGEHEHATLAGGVLDATM